MDEEGRMRGIEVVAGGRKGEEAEMRCWGAGVRRNINSLFHY